MRPMADIFPRPGEQSTRQSHTLEEEHCGIHVVNDKNAPKNGNFMPNDRLSRVQLLDNGL